jgi:uncharacterized membrane protein YbaN (DUF454 family)
VTSVGLAVVGAWLPLLPSVPFAILAAWAFSKSSPTLHAKLRADPRFGPALTNWEEYGAISPKAKITAMVAMSISLAALWLTMGERPYAAWGATFFMACSATFILTRPPGPEGLAEAEPEQEGDGGDRDDPGRP